MKNFIYIICVLFILASCNQKTKESSLYIKGLTEIITAYPNFDNGFEIVYNDNNEIAKLVGIGDNENSFINCSYNPKGQLTRIDYYKNNELAFHKNIEWFKDSLHITKVNLPEDSLSQQFSETYIYNENSNMTGIVRYVKDTDGMLKRRGSRYEFSWDDGNMTKILCYIESEEKIEDSIINAIESNTNFFELDEISNKIIQDGYELFYKSTYTYDDKENPYSNLSISSVLLPNEQNISKNNPLHIEKIYASGDTINFAYNYTYNEQNMPIESKVEVTTNSDFLPKANFARSFKY